jgi:hypothetical protein
MAPNQFRRGVFFDLRQRFVKHIRIQRERIKFLFRRQFVGRNALQLSLELIVIARRSLIQPSRNISLSSSIARTLPIKP